MLLGDNETDLELPDERKIGFLENEILTRSDAEYILEQRGRAAERVGNKELSSRVTSELEKVLTYLDGLRKELESLQKKS